MTREEFTAGWLLLTIQPWAKKYASQDTASKLQYEFYYSRLGRGHPEMWVEICRIYASGNHWPGVDELRLTMNSNLPRRLQLNEPTGGTEKPEFLVKLDAYRHAHACTVLDAIDHVLPEFQREQATHDDVAGAQALRKKLVAHRAHLQVLRQEQQSECGGA